MFRTFFARLQADAFKTGPLQTSKDRDPDDYSKEKDWLFESLLR